MEQTDLLARVRNHISEDQYQHALRTLIILFTKQEPSNKEYELFAYCLRIVGEETSAEIFEHALSDLNSILNQLSIGLYFMREGLYECALLPLRKCIDNNPGEPMFNLNLGITLLKLSRIQEAIRYLEIVFRMNQGPIAAHYLSYALILSKNIDEARKYSLHTDENHQEVLKKILERYDSNASSLREWHYIKTDAVLLREFTHSNEEFTMTVQTGLYTVMPIDNERLVDTLAGLQSVLGVFRETIGEISRILYISDRSRVLAEIFSEIRNLPIEQISGENLTSERSIIISVDTDEVESVGELLIQNPNGILFTLIHDWTREGSILPDIIGYMSQYGYLPWESKITVDESGEIIKQPRNGDTVYLTGERLVHLTTNVNFEYISNLINYYESRLNGIEVGKQRPGFRQRYERQFPYYSFKHY